MKVGTFGICFLALGWTQSGIATEKAATPAAVCRNQYAALGRALADQHLIWNGLSEVHRDYEPLLPAAARLSLDHMAVDSAAAAELTAIFERPGAKGGPDLKAQIAPFLIRQGIAMRFLSPAEVEAELEKLKKEGLVSEAGAHIESHGYLNEIGWNALVSRLMFPVLDPHDLVCHLPSFLLSGFRQAIQARSDSLLRILLKPADAAGKRQRALNWLTGRARNSSLENLVFLRGQGAESNLVVHGNFALKLAIFFNRPAGTSGQTEDLVELLMGSPSFYRGFFELPNIVRFLDSEPKRKTNFLDLLQKLGMEEPAKTEIRNKLTTLAARFLAEPRPAHDSTQDWASRVLNGLAREAARDTQLKEFFSETNRIRLLGEAGPFLEQYLDWSETVPVN